MRSPKPAPANLLCTAQSAGKPIPPLHVQNRPTHRPPTRSAPTKASEHSRHLAPGLGCHECGHQATLLVRCGGVGTQRSCPFPCLACDGFLLCLLAPQCLQLGALLLQLLPVGQSRANCGGSSGEGENNVGRSVLPHGTCSWERCCSSFCLWGRA